MDGESWLAGYFTGISLHCRLRVPYTRPSLIARMSVTGIAADCDWFADLSGVDALTFMTAEYAGDVTAAYSRDGRSYTAPAPMEEFLRANPAKLFHGYARIWFRFHLADDAADLTQFTLWGVLTPGGVANAV